MFKVSVEGDTLAELAANLHRIAQQFQTTVPEGGDANPARKGKGKQTAADLEPSRPEAGDDSEDDAALEAALKEKVEPAPNTAKGLVDGGTGKPVVPSDEPIKMTVADVRAAAAKLAAKDTPALGKLLEKYGAAKLSEVSPEKLGAFAADVVEALG